MPAAVIQSGHLVEAQRGDSVSLACSADGFPLPVITWWRNGELLNETLHSRYSRNDTVSDGFRSQMFPNVIQSGSVLLITGLAQEDEGNYTCRAQSANTTEAELIPPYQLIVSSPPTPSPSPSPSPSPAGRY